MLILGVFVSWATVALAAPNVTPPGFSLHDAQGQQWRLSDHAGQPVLDDNNRIVSGAINPGPFDTTLENFVMQLLEPRADSSTTTPT